MELADIKSRDDLRYYWQQVSNRFVWNAVEVEAARQLLVPVAIELALNDWVLYLDARKEYGIDHAASVARLSSFVEWAKMHRESVEDWLFADGLFCLGAMQDMIERPDDALNSYAAVFDEFGEVSNSALALIVAKSLYNAVVASRKSGKPSIVQYIDRLRQLADDNDDQNIRFLFANVLFSACYDAGKTDDLDVAKKHLEELRRLVKDHEEPAIRIPLAKALFNYSIKLEKIKAVLEAYQACKEAESWLQQSSDESTRPLHEQVVIRANRLRKKLNLPAKNLQKPKPRKQVPADKTTDPALPTEVPLTAPDSEASQAAQTSAQPPDVMARARMIQAHEDVVSEFKEVKDRFLSQMDRSKHRVDRFLDRNGRFARDASVLMVLRQWNSYTPIIVDGQESDRGGGYFVRHKDVGLVIDPGYNFIELFHKAGCKIVDITHVAITHAHDDHTAQLEQLLTMFHQFNTRNKSTPKKVTLLLNHSTQKKFSGFSLHKDCRYIEKVICLNAFDADNEQTVRLTKAGDISLTVLKAYHDDVFTTEYAIGLGLRIESATGVRRIVFTGDTGLYPPLLNDDGKPVFFDNRVQERRVVEREEEGINRKYPDEFQAPHVDLLVPHLGSIKEYEFNPPPSEPVSSDPATGEAQAGSLGPMFYPNHLGILGTAMVIKELMPKAVILSEFGSELRGLRMEIATLLRKALKKTMEEGSVPFIIPGDPSIVYNIPDGHFLCHEDGCFHPHNAIEAKEVGGDRIGLFKKGGMSASLDQFDKYREDLVNSEKKDAESFELSYMPKKS